MSFFNLSSFGAQVIAGVSQQLQQELPSLAVSLHTNTQERMAHINLTTIIQQVYEQSMRAVAPQLAQSNITEFAALVRQELLRYTNQTVKDAAIELIGGLHKPLLNLTATLSAQLNSSLQLAVQNVSRTILHSLVLPACGLVVGSVALSLGLSYLKHRYTLK